MNSRIWIQIQNFDFPLEDPDPELINLDPEHCKKKSFRPREKTTFEMSVHLGSETRRAECLWLTSWLAEWREVWLSLGGKGETGG